MFFFVCRSRSGRRLSPVMMDGEEKPGLSAKREDPSNAFKEVTRKFRAEL